MTKATLKVNGTWIYNLTGKTIRLWDSVYKEFAAIPADGMAQTHRRRTIEHAVSSICDTDARIGIIAETGSTSYNVDPVSDWIPEKIRDGSRWAAIVSDDYVVACRELGLPTDRLYTVGEPWIREGGLTIQGYMNLVKH